MNDDAQVLSQLSAYLQTLPTRAPDQVLRTALATVATTDQRRPWLPAIALRVGELRISRAAMVTFAALAGLVVVVVVAQIYGRLPSNLLPATTATPAPSLTLSPSPSPTAVDAFVPVPSAQLSSLTLSKFAFPFSVMVPIDGRSIEVGQEGVKLATLVTSASAAAADLPLTGDPYQAGTNGIAFTTSEFADFYQCPQPSHSGLHSTSRFEIPSDADFVTTLEAQAGATFSTSPLTIDGRPGFVASVSMQCSNEMNVEGEPLSDYLTLVGPVRTLELRDSLRRLYVVPVRDRWMIIQAWSSSVADRDAWFPIADQIVGSLAFTGRKPEHIDRSSSNYSQSLFVKPFTYQVPDGIRLSEGAIKRTFVSFVAPPLMTALRGWTPGNNTNGTWGNGITIASSADGLLDRCPEGSGGMIDVGPGDDFASLLREQAGFEFEATPVTLGGRQATVIQNVTARCLGHLHVGQSFLSQVGQVGFGSPYQQIYLVPLVDTTLVIDIWSDSQDEFDAWLPIADRIVDSMHFSGE